MVWPRDLKSRRELARRYGRPPRSNAGAPHPLKPLPPRAGTPEFHHETGTTQQCELPEDRGRISAAFPYPEDVAGIRSPRAARLTIRLRRTRTSPRAPSISPSQLPVNSHRKPSTAAGRPNHRSRRSRIPTRISEGGSALTATADELKGRRLRAVFGTATHAPRPARGTRRR